MICGRKAFTIGHVTEDAHLAALTTLAKHMGSLVGNRPLRMLEVGSWVGESAIALLGGAPKGSELFCVDTWEGTSSDATHLWARIEPPFPWFLKNLEGLIGVSVKPIKGHSLDVAASFAESQDLDLVFIDADHTYDACRADIRAWIRHVAPTGILCGHDYGLRQLPGVKVAVDEFAEEFGLHVTVITGTSIWFIGKAQTLPKTAPAQATEPEHERGRITAS
jgi:SAM-dependent methyltransferase